MDIITVFINNISEDTNFSDRLARVLGFDEFANRCWLREFDNIAYADEMIRALDEIGYQWSVVFEVDTPWRRKEITLCTLDDWSRYYSEDEGK